MAGNILHFNVGATVDLEVPRNFWSRVAGKYGNMFYWKEKVQTPPTPPPPINGNLLDQGI